MVGPYSLGISGLNVEPVAAIKQNELAASITESP